MQVSECWKKYIKISTKSKNSKVERILLNYLEENKIDYLFLSNFIDQKHLSQKEIYKYLGEIKYFKMLTRNYKKRNNKYYIILKKVNARRS
ncbi:hypothetical protein [Enterococcus hirae]|uniref:hypothetical protein n=1 Tax=Enterococcus hirae TaxID=1354 RepID=UPI001A957CF4|nr:hypothetical protein [Enterococcus hirae]MBO1103562.1 hypothetical protein [Enterococcus hirae]